MRRSGALLLSLFLLSYIGWAAEAGALFAQAVKEQQAGDYDGAIRDYRTFLRSYPKSPDALANLGAALAHTGHFDEAAEQYRAALRLDGQNLAIQSNLALAYYKQGNWAKAAGEFRQVQARQPEDVRTAVLLGDCEARLGRNDEAVKLLEPLDARHPGNPDLEYVLGTALIGIAQRQKGAAMLQQVAEATGSAGAYLLAGTTFLQLNDYERARHNLEGARKLDPALPAVHTSLGTVLDDLGDTAGAIAELREAIQQNGTDVRANLLLGAILLKRRELGEAEQYLQRAVQLEPEAAMGHYEMGLLRSAQGNNSAAVTEMEQAASALPNWLQPHVQLAALYYKVHRESDGARERAIVDRLTEEQRKQESPPRP